MGMQKVTCWSCSRTWEFTPPMARGETCEHCGWDAKVCKNCKFFDTSAYRECREEQAELVKDKDKRNFCSWFESNSSVTSGVEKQNDNPLDALFGSLQTPKVKSKFEEEMENFFKK